MRQLFALTENKAHAPEQILGALAAGLTLVSLGGCILILAWAAALLR